MKDEWKKEEWVIKYLKEHIAVSVLDVDFVDRYIETFNPKHKATLWGANKCNELGRLLSSMYNQGILKRDTCGVQGGSEFPKWVYVYQLAELGKRMS